MTMRRNLLLVLAALALPGLSLAQTGLPPFGSIDQIGLEYRNNQDLNVLLAIPIMSSPGRGLNLNFSLVYNSSIWAPDGTIWLPSSNNAYFGWTTSYNTGGVSYKYQTGKSFCNRVQLEFTYITEYSNYQYTDPYGTPHSFNLSWDNTDDTCTGQNTTTGTFTSYATDGSGYYAVISASNPAPPTIYAPNGVIIGSAGLTDINGNYISSTTSGSETDWTDSAGRVALKVITGTSTIQYEALNPSGGYETTTLNLQNLPVKTNFGCSGITEYTGTVSVPQSLALPNGQTYTFAYEPSPGNSGYYTGRLQQVTLPTHGYYEYTYTGSNDGINCADGTTLGMNRTVNDDTNPPATWNYVRNTTNLTTTITTPKLIDTPQANDMVITFNSSGQEVSRKIYANSPGSGTPLRTINTTWATNGTPATKITILEDGSTQSEVATSYNSNGLLSSVSEYNFGTGAPGSLFRTTSYTYETSTNYTNLNLINLVTSKQIQNGSGTVQYLQNITYDGVAITSANCETGAAQHYDSGYPCTFNYRGNPTQVNTYLAPATQSNPVTRNFTYDWFGNLITAQLNCCQNKTWAYASATQYSLPTSVTSGSSPGPTLTTSYTYYFPTGQVSTVTDPNNLVTTFQYDVYSRPTSTSQSNGSTNGESVSISYNDSAFTSTTTATINSSSSIQQITAVDGLGRPNLSTIEDASSNIYSKVSATYDLANRPYQTSNPYTGTSPSYWTATFFDVLGRPTSITLQDNSVTAITYATNTTTAQDPAGNQRESVMDAAGRLSTIYEPNPPSNNNPTLPTSYTYSVLDELTQITQGSQTRTYVYDALGRLNSATTPEAGAVCFGTYSGSTCQSNGYDQFNNLLYRTDARGVVTDYIYDSLNRLLGIAYPTVPSGVSAMPNVCETTGSSSNNARVCFTYGTSASSYNNGALVTMTDPVGSENYTYSALEQLTQLQKVINGSIYTTGYAYNLASQLTQITYPSGRIVQQSVDAIGRLCEIAPSTTGCGTASSPYATGFGYGTAMQVTGFKYGNGLYASLGFAPDRLHLNCLDYSTTNRSSCTHDSTTLFGLSYSYPATPGNNGLISSITDSVDNGRTATYTYDALYRLVTAVTNGSTNYPAWGLQQGYDRYGNRNTQGTISGSGCTGSITCPTFSSTASTSTNRLPSPYTYDAGGNMTYDGFNTLVYDGENRAVSATNGSAAGAYVYDGNGLRVQKCLPTCGGSNPNTVYLFSGPKVIAEYDNGAGVSTPSREYIYSGAVLLARIDSSGTRYYHQDHLSNRLVTNSSGGVLEQLGTFPFGEQWYNASADKLYFTTYERDSESGNDYAQARYNVSPIARFNSPDPIAGSTSDPQSLNRYSYVRNMPVMLTDPAGLTPQCNTVKTNEAQPDHLTGGGPAPSESDRDLGESDPGAPQQWPGCGSIPPWYDTSGGGGNDPFFGAGLGGVGYLDGGYNGDDSGTGVGSPLGYAGGIGSQLDILGLAFTPTDTFSYYGTVNNEPVLMTGYVYGNWDLLSLLAGGSGGAQQQIKAIINLALHEPKLSKCLNQIFGPGNILNNQNLPHVDTTQTSTQLTNYINSLNPNTPVSNPDLTTASTFATPVPATGQGTVFLASDYFYDSSTSDTFLAASYIHETGNILAIQRNRSATAPNLPAMLGDTDTGAALEYCIFGGSVKPDGTVRH
jgi:RHS repeat-associated protein